MPETEPAAAATCPGCGANIPLADFRRQGFLRARRPTDGGPYYELDCHRCATLLVLMWESDRSRVVAAKPPAGILGQALRPGAHARQRFPPEEAAESPSEPSRGRGDDANPADAGARPGPESESEPEPEPGPRPASTEDVDRLYGILGVDATAGRASVLAAFRERSKRLHPDRFSEYDRDFQALAHRKFIELTRARDELLAIMERREP